MQRNYSTQCGHDIHCPSAQSGFPQNSRSQPTLLLGLACNSSSGTQANLTRPRGMSGAQVVIISPVGWTEAITNPTFLRSCLAMHVCTLAYHWRTPAILVTGRHTHSPCGIMDAWIRAQNSVSKLEQGPYSVSCSRGIRYILPVAFYSLSTLANDPSFGIYLLVFDTCLL